MVRYIVNIVCTQCDINQWFSGDFSREDSQYYMVLLWIREQCLVLVFVLTSKGPISPMMLL